MLPTIPVLASYLQKTGSANLADHVDKISASLDDMPVINHVTSTADHSHFASGQTLILESNSSQRRCHYMIDFLEKVQLMWENKAETAHLVAPIKAVHKSLLKDLSSSIVMAVVMHKENANGTFSNMEMTYYMEANQTIVVLRPRVSATQH